MSRFHFVTVTAVLACVILALVSSRQMHDNSNQMDMKVESVNDVSSLSYYYSGEDDNTFITETPTAIPTTQPSSSNHYSGDDDFFDTFLTETPTAIPTTQPSSSYYSGDDDFFEDDTFFTETPTAIPTTQPSSYYYSGDDDFFDTEAPTAIPTTQPSSSYYSGEDDVFEDDTFFTETPTAIPTTQPSSSYYSGEDDFFEDDTFFTETPSAVPSAFPSAVPSIVEEDPTALPNVPPTAPPSAKMPILLTFDTKISMGGIEECADVRPIDKIAIADTVLKSSGTDVLGGGSEYDRCEKDGIVGRRRYLRHSDISVSLLATDTLDLFVTLRLPISSNTTIDIDTVAASLWQQLSTNIQQAFDSGVFTQTLRSYYQAQNDTVGLAYIVLNITTEEFVIEYPDRYPTVAPSSAPGGGKDKFSISRADLQLFGLIFGLLLSSVVVCSSIYCLIYKYKDKSRTKVYAAPPPVIEDEDDSQFAGANVEEFADHPEWRLDHKEDPRPVPVKISKIYASPYYVLNDDSAEHLDFVKSILTIVEKESGKIREDACLVLRKISNNTGSVAKKNLCTPQSHVTIDTLVDVLRKAEEKDPTFSDNTTRIHACAALRNLASFEGNRQYMCSKKLDLVAILRDILSADPASHGELQVVAAGVVKNLSTFKGNRKQLGSKGTGLMVVIRDIVQHTYSPALDNLMSALRNLSKNSDSLTYLCSAELGLVKVLVEMIYKESSSGHWSKAANIITNLTALKSNKKYLAFREPGVVEALVGIVQNAWGEESQAAACESIAHLASIVENSPGLLAEERLVFQTLMEVIAQDEGKAREFACEAICNFCSFEQNRETFAEPKLGMVQALTNLAAMQSGLASKHAEATLKELQKNGPYMYNLVSKLYEPKINLLNMDFVEAFEEKNVEFG